MINATCPKCKKQNVFFCDEYNEYQCMTCNNIFKIKEMKKMTVPEIKINGQFPDGLRITIEKWDILVEDNEQVSIVLNIIDDFNKQIEDKINKPYQEEIANMLRQGNFPKLDKDIEREEDKYIPCIDKKNIDILCNSKLHAEKLTMHDHPTKVKKKILTKFIRGHYGKTKN